MSFNAQRELKRFLAEDIRQGDLTSKLLGQKEITAEIITRQDAIVAGANFAKQIFSLNGCSVKIVTNDGKKAKANQSILRIKGKAYSILACERTALNLLSRMCGIATNTNHLVSIIKKNKSKSNLFATRKTAPGLRQFDKIAVEIGGGRKHRMSLDESILIKDNHISVEPLETLIQKAKKTRKKIEVEVENQNDAILVAQLGVTIIMLDNFTPKDIKKTIKKMKELKLLKYVKLEASGRINEKNIAQYAKTGVDMISVGEITNSSLGIDLSLEIN